MQKKYGVDKELTPFVNQGKHLSVNLTLGFVQLFLFRENDPHVTSCKFTNEELYECLGVNPRKYKRNLSTLACFNGSYNFMFDIIHSIVEGVAQYEVLEYTPTFIYIQLRLYG